MAASTFSYVTYIRTTPEKLWEALTKPEFTRQYWAGTHQECAWTKGAVWKLMAPDGRVADIGEVVDIESGKRLVLDWAHQLLPGPKAEGVSRCTYDLEEVEGAVKLTITHELDKRRSQLIESVSQGWPHILASLKSLLETGETLEGADKWPEGL